jgi:alkylation response protein AidB-like acyl-CoA dehydrogenase
MDLSPSETQSLVQKTARDFAERVVMPRAAEIDASGTIAAEIVRGLGDLGLMAVNVPTEVGGAGAGVVAYALAVQEVARACASTAVTMSVSNMVGETIARFGTPAQKAHYCPLLAQGSEGLGCFALSEPDAGSDPAGMKTTAHREAAGWVLQGNKQWISGGSDAAVFVVWARTSESEGRPRLSCFLVEGGAPGLRVGRPEDKMGLRGSHTVPLEFADCRVAGDALLGDENDGFRIALAALDGGRIGIGAQAVGIARAALEESVRYAKERRAFGVPIADHQAIQFKLADMQTSIEAAQLLCLRAAWLKEAGRPFTREASMAKLFASEMAVRVCNDAVQIHGGYGYTRDFPAERHLRDARVTTLYEGTSEIQRLVIARSTLND